MAPAITELEAATILFSLLVFALFTLTGMLSENGNGLLTKANFLTVRQKPHYLSFGRMKSEISDLTALEVPGHRGNLGG